MSQFIQDKANEFSHLSFTDAINSGHKTHLRTNAGITLIYKKSGQYQNRNINSSTLLV